MTGELERRRRRGIDAPLIALATHSGAPAGTEDDVLAVAALRRGGFARAECVPWDTPQAAWDRYAAVLIRSTWDYHLRPGAFLAWVAEVEARGIAIWNPAPVVRWNADKRYLADLEAAGVRIVPTEFISRGDPISLRPLLARRGWPTAVVKPSVAATAFRTRRIHLDGDGEHAKALAEVLTEADGLVQPLLPEVGRDGEWSLVFFDDGQGALAFSHGVLKRPAPTDFRVQPEFGGNAAAAVPPADLLRQACEAAACVARVAPGPLLYARLDGILSDGAHAPEGAFMLMEAELIEPMLFLAHAGEAADRFARAVARRMAATRSR